MKPVAPIKRRLEMQNALTLHIIILVITILGGAIGGSGAGRALAGRKWNTPTNGVVLEMVLGWTIAILGIVASSLFN